MPSATRHLHPWPDPIRHASIGSTNLEAVRLARAGAPHGTSVTAAEQTGGRGRLGRAWISPPGNLYVSFVLRPSVAAQAVAQIGFVAALAVADTVDSVLPSGSELPGRAALKWPNDVLIDGAKISGILAERGDGAADWLVLGIGLNVGFAPDGLAYSATCLHAQGAAITVDAALATLSAALRTRVGQWETHGFAPIRTDWLARAHPSGTALRVHLGETVLDCAFETIANDGALLVRTADGQRRLVAGDVALAPQAP
jgi:BirA family biotin operon repressor/biotin-[acetyl-CoA-carboxylase] ligase